MMDRMMSGLNRSVRGIACTGMALVVAMTMTSSAQAQGSVIPSGAGTLADPYQISELGNLVWIGDNVGSSSGKYYTVQHDIDASDTTNWNSGAGFAPIGTGDYDGIPVVPFMGTFDGNGKVISNLAINRPSENNVSLFGYAGSSGVVKNLGLVGGAVTGYRFVGGLVGNNNGGSVSNCYATCPVTASDNYAGGLVGCSVGTVSDCHATGQVTGGYNFVGGLMGINLGVVRGCYATGPASGPGAGDRGSVGGLVGNNNGGSVSNCYATGSATASKEVGGLVGASCGTVSGCYATGPATGGSSIGGLVGYNYGTGTVSNSYWDTQTSGQATSDGGTGKTTAQMKQQATFAGWDFVNVWRITENVTYPFFRALTMFTDDFEGSSLNPFWTTNAAAGCSIALVSSPVHSGSGAVLFNASGGGQKDVSLSHVFPTLQSGKVSVWVYDNEDYIYISFFALNTSSGRSAYLGVMDWDYSCYYYMLPGDIPVKSTVPRTRAWHQFTINATADALTLSVDGQVVTTGPGGFLFDKIILGMTGPGAGSTAYDDFSFESAPTRGIRRACVPNDFDGDGRSDIGCYYADGGKWYVFQSTKGFWATNFGYVGTVPVTGDFDGDGKTDIGCYYAPEGKWHVFKSSEGLWETQFGYAGTIPVTGDFDGDGKTDIGCYYPPGGNWYVFKSTEGFWQTTFGYAGTVPVTGDFDGDGKTDIGCYYAPGGNWYVFKSTEGFWETQFGYNGTVPVTGDFDGDGRTDIGCYYAPEGHWYIFKSTEGFWETLFGYAGTVPVTGDFDGDGRTDFGCYYAPGGNWYMFKSTEGFWETQFGYSGTVPLK